MTLRGTHLVLDVDDTLYLERSYVRSGFDAVDLWLQENYNIHGVGDMAWELFQNGCRGTTLGDALRHLAPDRFSQLVPEIVDVYRQHEPRIELLPDSSQLMTLLAERGEAFSVLSDGPLQSQRNKCTALGLDKLSSTILLSSEYGRSKPDPWLFKELERRSGFSGRLMAYIADNPLKDFDAPSRLGWACHRIRRRGGLHVNIPTPPGVLEHEDLTSIVKELEYHAH